MKANYPNNIYIKNHAAVAAMGGDIGVTLDKYDKQHGIKYSELARAQYTHWRAEQTGASSLLSARQKELLGIQ